MVVANNVLPTSQLSLSNVLKYQVQITTISASLKLDWLTYDCLSRLHMQGERAFPGPGIPHHAREHTDTSFQIYQNRQPGLVLNGS